ncbi:iron-sulfur cluster assembly accessory protein, partial [Streptomyces sp. NPDC013087]|uniref:iron-sulfur cluster assembly accessory protein n=1 Tax=Streptomyces sp. NPDC013087 TaxID=3156694 RepID=UPI0033D54E11
MSVSDETTTVSDGILLSDAAASKVKALLEQEGRDDLALRVAVQPGGCSGLRYQLFFDERSLDGDVVKDFGGVKVVTDRMSAPYLGGLAGARAAGDHRRPHALHAGAGAEQGVGLLRL